jgi:aspartokinase
LLEIYAILVSINAVKDSDSVHYESLVNEYTRLVAAIHDNHVHAAKTQILNPATRSALIKEIEAECNEILDYRLAAERWKLEIDSRSKDRIVSFGEKLSCRFVAALLQDRVRPLSKIVGLLILTGNRVLTPSTLILPMSSTSRLVRYSTLIFLFSWKLPSKRRF